MAAATTSDRYLVFTLGDEDFAIPLLKVREVIALPKVTPIPQSPSHVLGLMNIRGHVITLIDLRLKMGVKVKSKEDTSVIICDINGIQVGVVVDTINSVAAPKEEEVTTPPHMDNAKAAQYVFAVYRKDKSLILFLDLDKILNIEEIKSSQSKKQAA